MTETAVNLDSEQRAIVEKTIADHSKIRGWILHAVIVDRITFMPRSQLPASTSRFRESRSRRGAAVGSMSENAKRDGSRARTGGRSAAGTSMSMMTRECAI
jgi:hypothetical protein